MPDTNPYDACPLCDGVLAPVSEERAIAVGKRSAVVRDEFYRCDSCGEDLYAPGQMNASMRRASDRIREAEGLLLPSEIRTIRENLGLSQQAFEALLGVGAKTVVRWEKGTVFQNNATDSLIRLLAAFPAAAAFLAKRHGVKLSFSSAATATEVFSFEHGGIELSEALIAVRTVVPKPQTVFGATPEMTTTWDWIKA